MISEAKSKVSQATESVDFRSRTGFAGGVTVPIYETSSAGQVEWILADSAAKALVVETAEHEAIVASAQARGVPLISYKQLLDWTDGRNASTIRGLNWSAGTFTFVTTAGAGANGLQTLLPTQGPTGTLSALTCGGSPRAYTVQTIKGIQYAMFDTITGTCQATYS